MNRLAAAITEIHQQEEGHALPATASLVGAIGAILIGVGAANDAGALAIAGGIIAGVGFLSGTVLSHLRIDYDIYARIEKLEKK